jgi:hypothetical protein
MMDGRPIGPAIAGVIGLIALAVLAFALLRT